MPKMQETAKDRILDAAERTFGLRGYDGTSTRMIAAAAHAQQPLIHYHFGTKFDLYRALWERRYSDPAMGQDDLAHLDFSSNQAEVLRSVVKHLIAPPFRLSGSIQGRAFLQILNWELSDPRAGERGLLATFIEPIEKQVLAALSRALPEVPPYQLIEVKMLIFSVVGAAVAGWARADQAIAARPISMDRLVEFTIGGLLKISTNSV